MKNVARRSLSAFVLVFAGCVTPGSAVHQRGTPANDGASLVTVLGADYTLPSYVTVTSSSSPAGKGGAAGFVFHDDVTTCTVRAQFETVGDANLHESFVTTERHKAYEDAWTKGGGTFERKDSTVTLLGAEARQVAYSVKLAGDVGGVSVIDHHFGDQSRSVLFSVFCNDPLLLRKEGETVVRIVNSQKRL